MFEAAAAAAAAAPAAPPTDPSLPTAEADTLPAFARLAEDLFAATALAFAISGTAEGGLAELGAAGVLSRDRDGLLDELFEEEAVAVVVRGPIARACDDSASLLDFSLISRCFSSSLARIGTRSSGIGLFSCVRKQK